MDDHIIVGGPPRSGTRFITNALNHHRDVHIHGEVFRRVLVEALDFFSKCDGHYKTIETQNSSENRRAGDKLWNEKKPAVFYNIIQAGQKFHLRKKSTNAVSEGFKLPQVETYWRSLLDVIGGYSFVYCLRPFEAHYLSCVNRWPEKNISTLAEHYRTSVSLAHEMLEHQSVRLVCFSLEELTRNGREHLIDVANGLELRGVKDWADQIEPGVKANSSEKFVDHKRTNLTEKEHKFIQKNGELTELYEKFWERYAATTSVTAT